MTNYVTYDLDRIAIVDLVSDINGQTIQDESVIQALKSNVPLQYEEVSDEEAKKLHEGLTRKL